MPEVLPLSVLSIVVLLSLMTRLCSRSRSGNSRPRRRARVQSSEEKSRGGRRPPKPIWVRREVVRLKALMPDAGWRRIAITFNHLHRRRGMSVGKSFVASVLRDSQEEVLRTRGEIRRRKPRRIPRNLIWALDLTFVSGDPLPVLGILDHGSRACLELRKVPWKRSITLLRVLLETIERFGIPKTIRTDNESIFVSRVFSWSLAFLGIRHQRIAPFAPWQNGRIERFFGTFKRALQAGGKLVADEPVGQAELAEFCVWYNHVRPHQNLDGLTPAEAWTGRATDRRKRPQWVSGWKGALSGFYWPSSS